MAFPNEIVISGTLCNVEYKTAANGNSYMTGGLKVYQGKRHDDTFYIYYHNIFLFCLCLCFSLSLPLSIYIYI